MFCHSEQSEESDVVTSKTNNSDSWQAQNDKFAMSLSKCDPQRIAFGTYKIQQLISEIAPLEMKTQK